MNHSTGNLTLAQSRRFRALKALGCVACKLNGDNTDELVEPEIHHMLAGNKRIGHDATVGLCSWHHRGDTYDGVPEAWFLANVGPSWHRHRREFRQRYGSDAELLETVNRMLEGK